MIYLYTGTPGSGKSFHTALDIVRKTRKKNENKVIANFPVTIENQNNFTHIDTMEMTPKVFEEFAYKHHKPYKENQSLIIIDEGTINI